MSRADIKKRIASNMQRAAELSARARMLRDEGALDEAGLSGIVRAYVLAKYRLDEGEALDASGMPLESLQELAQASLDKALSEAPEAAAQETMSATCDGASSIDMKQSLLLMALQSDFDFMFEGFDAAFVDTVGEGAAYIWKAYLRSAGVDKRV